MHRFSELTSLRDPMPMRIRNPKIKIVWFARDLYDPRVIHACSADGKQLTLTKCVIPDKRRVKSLLYSDGKKHFFSLCRGKLTEVFDNFGICWRTPGMHCHNGKRGNDYPQMRDYGAWYCHIIVLLTYKGPRPIGNDGQFFEADHKNGDVTDYSNENLEWVSRQENRWRSNHVLKVLRVKGIDPTTYTGSQMDKWFALFRCYEQAHRQPLHIPAVDLLRAFDRFTLTDPLAAAAEEPARDFDIFVERDD